MAANIRLTIRFTENEMKEIEDAAWQHVTPIARRPVGAWIRERVLETARAINSGRRIRDLAASIK